MIHCHQCCVLRRTSIFFYPFCRLSPSRAQVSTQPLLGSKQGCTLEALHIGSMPNDVNSFLHRALDKYGRHIQASGAHNPRATYRNPNLANSILPFFEKRWASGPGQHIRDIYPFTKDAFKLASRLLTERFPLMWFCHLTFGERRRDRSGTHIVPMPYSTSFEAITKVRQNILHVGEVTTFMFQPPGHRGGGHFGETCRYKKHQPFYGRLEAVTGLAYLIMFFRAMVNLWL